MGGSLFDGDGVAIDNHLKYALQPLFTKYKVDMAMWGHVHAWERTCGFVGNYTCGADDSEGTVHIVGFCIHDCCAVANIVIVLPSSPMVAFNRL